MRAFLGWLRGEADHCSMAAIPTLAEEDGKRPTRERESRVNERSRIVNRMKGALARLGIRGFNPKLRKAAEQLEQLRTGAGEPLPPNTLAGCGATRRSCASSRRQIQQIEKARDPPSDLSDGERRPKRNCAMSRRSFARVLGGSGSPRRCAAVSSCRPPCAVSD